MYTGQNFSTTQASMKKKPSSSALLSTSFRIQSDQVVDEEVDKSKYPQMDSANKTSMKRPSVNLEASTTPSKRAKRGFQTRCNPKVNFKLIHSMKGHEGFLRIICELGLDSLIHLQVSRLQRELCADLARRVDVGNSVLSVHGADIPLNCASVTKVMGFPCSGLCYALLLENSNEEQGRVCSRYNLDVAAKISQYTLLEFLQDNQRFDGEFKAKLLLFIIATLIRPTTNVNLHFKEYIPMLSNMECLSDFNWAQFLLHGLLDAVNTFQLRGAKSVGGCLLYLQLLYLHCISPVPWTRFDECLMAKPSLQSWTDERVSVIVKLMRQQGGIQSNRVIVRLSGIPHADATVDDYILPQLLVHEVLISRLKLRLDAKEFGLHQTIDNICQFMKQLDKRLKCLEDPRSSGATV